MSKKGLFSVILVLALGFSACQEDDVSIPEPSTLGIKILALNTSYTLPVAKSITKSAVAEVPSMEWNTVQMVVSEIEMEAEMKSLVTQNDSIEIEFEWNGPQQTNLLDSTMSFGNFVLQPGFYDEIELEIKGKKEDAPSSPVFYMNGDYTNEQEEVIPVIVEVHSDMEFKTEKESVEVSERNMEITSYIQLYLDELFSNITPEELNNANLTGEVLIISAQNNTDLYQEVLGKLLDDHESEYWHNGEHYDDDDDDDDSN
mgnify:CR=1 FL=1